MYRNDMPGAGLLPHGALPDGQRDAARVWEDAAVDLVVRGVGKAFTAGQPVLEGIEFSIPAGQSVALIGSNGAGKSTLLRCCMHLIAPDLGTVYLFGQPLQAQNEAGLRALRSQVGFVFQKHNLVPRLSALSNVLHGALTRAAPGRAWFQGTAPRTLREEAMHCLDRVGLADKALQRADHLSGGQQQRVAVARAIAFSPEVLLFDEPLSNLDAKLRVQTRLEIQKLHRRLSTTSLYVTHDQVEAMTLAQRMIVMNAGRAEQVGTPDDVYSRPATTFVASFIGSPPMNLFEGRLESDGLTFAARDGVKVALPMSMGSLAGRELILGVRPEHLLLGGGNLPMQVETVEMLGAEHLIHGVVAGHDVIVRTGPHENPPPGATLQLGFKPDAVHWFDAGTGARVDG